MLFECKMLFSTLLRQVLSVCLQQLELGVTLHRWLKENVFCAVRKAFSYFWLQCGYSVTNVVVQCFFITVPPGGGFVLDCIVFLIFFEIEELQSSKIAQVCKKSKGSYKVDEC